MKTYVPRVVRLRRGDRPRKGWIVGEQTFRDLVRRVKFLEDEVAKLTGKKPQRFD